MGKGIIVTVNAADCARLEAVVANGNSPQKHVWRCRTTTLFAALNVLEGKVIGRCMQRHRHKEFIGFLNAIEA
jgi:poly(A) polymerase Pap1